MGRLFASFPLLIFLASTVTAADDAGQKTITYLLSLESPHGGFRADAKQAPSLRATNAALRALKYFAGRPARVEAHRDFILACRDAKTGGFANVPDGKPDVVLTAIGLMAMVELKLPTRKVEKEAIAYLSGNAKTFEEVRMAAAGLEAVGKGSAGPRKWTAELKRGQNADGTFGKGDGLPRDTGSAVACLLRLGDKLERPRLVLAALDKGQRSDGGFARSGAKTSDLETSYRIVRTYHMLGTKPGRSDNLRAFIAKCRNADGGYGVTPGAASSVGGTYFAGIILHWLDAK